MRRRDLGVLHSRVSDVSISDAARPAPSLRHKMRKGLSVTPTIGASTTDDGNTYCPICMMKRFQRAESFAQEIPPPGAGRHASISNPTAFEPGSTNVISASIRCPADKSEEGGIARGG